MLWMIYNGVRRGGCWICILQITLEIETSDENRRWQNVVLTARKGDCLILQYNLGYRIMKNSLDRVRVTTSIFTLLYLEAGRWWIYCCDRRNSILLSRLLSITIAL